MNTFEECKSVFLERREERKIDRFLLVALNGAKGNKNEIVIEFNRRFDHIV